MMRAVESGSRNGEASTASAARTVAYIMSRFPLLTETFILREMLELEAQGLRLEIFPLLRAKQKVRHAEVDRLAADVHFTPFLSASILFANLRILRRGPRRYLRLLWSTLRANWGSLNLFIGAIGIFPKSVYFASLVERLGVGHVHAHFATHPALSALIVSELSGVSFSFTAHAHDIFLHPQMLAEKMRMASFVVSISEFNKRTLLGRAPDLPPGKIKVVHCGIELQNYDEAGAARDRAQPQGRALHALCVASLQPYKGLKHLIGASARIVERVPGFRCSIIGQGGDREALEALIRKLGLQDTVQLLGGRPQHEVTTLLSEADLFVLPSVIAPSGQMEGIPVALMEAMASHLPVVSTRISGIPELVEHGKSGFLVEPTDEAALADAIVALCEDPDLRRRMGATGRERVAAEFQLNESVAQLRLLFEDAMRSGELAGDLTDWIRNTLRRSPDASWNVRFSKVGAGRDSEVYEVAGGEGAELVLKLHRPSWAEDASAVCAGERHARNEYEALCFLSGGSSPGAPALAVPRPISLNPDHAALLMEKCAGEKLTRVMRWTWLRPGARARLPHLFRSCGQWLSKFHEVTRQPGDVRPVLERVEREFFADLKACRVLGLDPNLAAAAAQHFDEGKSSAFAAQTGLVGRHCDFAPYNILVDESRVTVIDFEGFQQGLPFDDLCYFLSMVKATPSYHIGRASLGHLCSEFLHGYQQHGPLDRDSLRFFMVPAMLKIMASSPVVSGADGGLLDVKRRQRLRFYRQWFLERFR